MAVNASDIAEVGSPTGKTTPEVPGLRDRLVQLTSQVNETGDPAAAQELTNLIVSNQKEVSDLFRIPEREGLKPIAERLDNPISQVDETGDPKAANDLHELLANHLDTLQGVTRGEIARALPESGPITPAGAYFDNIEETKPPEVSPTPAGEAPTPGVPPTPPEIPPGISGAPTPESGTPPTPPPPPSTAPIAGQGVPSAAGVPPMTPKAQDLVNQIQAYEGERYSPEFVKMQQDLGLEVVPGVRLQDADDAGLMFTLLQQGKITPEEWGTFVDDLRSSGKIQEVAAPAPAPVPRENIIEAWKKGLTEDEIAQSLDVPLETVKGIVQEHYKVPTPQPNDEAINSYKEAVKGLVDGLNLGDEEKVRFKQAIDEQTTAQGVDQVFKTGPAPVQEAAPVPLRAPRGGPKYDLAKAVERGDRATIIKGYGGFNSRARLIRTYEPEERKKLFPFMRRGAQGPDSLLQELQHNYPHLFGNIESDDDFLRLIISGEIYRTTDIDDLIKAEEDYYNDIVDQADREGIDKAGLAEVERDVEREVNAEESDLTGEAGATEEAPQGAGNIPGLTPPKPKAPSVIDQKVAEAFKITPFLDEGKLRRVLRALPDATATEAAMLAQDDELFNQVAKGNLSATEREQLYKNHKEAQGQLPGMGEGGLFDQEATPAPKVPGVTPPKTAGKATPKFGICEDPGAIFWPVPVGILQGLFIPLDHRHPARGPHCIPLFPGPPGRWMRHP